MNMNVQPYSQDRICSAIARDMYPRCGSYLTTIILIPWDIHREHPGESGIEELVQKLETISKRHGGLISRGHVLSTRYLAVGWDNKEEAIIFTRECQSNLLSMQIVTELWDSEGNPVSTEPTPPRRARKKQEVS